MVRRPGAGLFCALATLATACSDAVPGSYEASVLIFPNGEVSIRARSKTVSCNAVYLVDPRPERCQPTSTDVSDSDCETCVESVSLSVDGIPVFPISRRGGQGLFDLGESADKPLRVTITGCHGTAIFDTEVTGAFPSFGELSVSEDRGNVTASWDPSDVPGDRVCLSFFSLVGSRCCTSDTGAHTFELGTGLTGSFSLTKNRSVGILRDGDHLLDLWLSSNRVTQEN